MNRRSFFGRLLVGAGVVAAVPALDLEAAPAPAPMAPPVPPPRSAVPCEFCIKMVADTCRSRGRCLHDAYREGVIARQPGLEHYEAHAGVVRLPVLDPFDWDPHAR